MIEHLSDEQLERYHGRGMSPEELLAADDHAARCEACRQRLEAGTSLDPMFAAVRDDLAAAAEPEHLSYDQIEAYVEHRLDAADREVVESHMTLCDPCAAEVRDLNAFRIALATAPAKTYLPATPR